MLLRKSFVRIVPCGSRCDSLFVLFNIIMLLIIDDVICCTKRAEEESLHKRVLYGIFLLVSQPIYHNKGL
jgi:hypothetical protein